MPNYRNEKKPGSKRRPVDYQGPGSDPLFDHGAGASGNISALLYLNAAAMAGNANVGPPAPQATHENRRPDKPWSRLAQLAKIAFLRTDQEEINRGNISPLVDRGFLNILDKKNNDIELIAHRYDSTVQMDKPVSLKKGELEQDENLKNFLFFSDGNHVTAKNAQLETATMGTYWNRHKLGENVTVIKVDNGMRGTVGIKIPFENIVEGNPIIVISGALSGCTIIYAVDDHYFYCYHTGTNAFSNDWKTGSHGIISTHQSHSALTGRQVPDLEHHNNSLNTIFSSYKKSVITFMGKNAKTASEKPTHITEKTGNVETFDYNKVQATPHGNSKRPRPQVAYSYALLQRSPDRLNIEAYSENAEIDTKKSKTIVLDSLQRRLL